MNSQSEIPQHDFYWLRVSLNGKSCHNLQTIFLRIVPKVEKCPSPVCVTQTNGLIWLFYLSDSPKPKHIQMWSLLFTCFNNMTNWTSLSLGLLFGRTQIISWHVHKICKTLTSILSITTVFPKTSVRDQVILYSINQSINQNTLFILRGNSFITHALCKHRSGKKSEINERRSKYIKKECEQ